MLDTPHTPESILAEFAEPIRGPLASNKVWLNEYRLARYAALWRNEAADSEEIAVRLQKENEQLRKERDEHSDALAYAYAELNKLWGEPETPLMFWPERLASIIADRDRLAAENEELRKELESVLSDWNALVRATGSPTNGGAVGHANALRADRDRLAAIVQRVREVGTKYERRIEQMSRKKSKEYNIATGAAWAVWDDLTRALGDDA